MKNLIKIIFILAYPVLLTNSGCSKSPEKSIANNVITVNVKQKVINVQQKGLEITFCLLNEQGQPATVFRQGENFKFYLAIKNNVKDYDSMYIVSSFLANPDLFRVHDENGTIIGSPWKLGFCYYVTDVVNKLNRGKEWSMESSWQEKQTNDSTEMHFLQCYFHGLDQPMLAPGKYYTSFSQQFSIGAYHPHPSTGYIVRTDTLNFKINFEIK